MSRKDTSIRFEGVYAALVTPRRPDTIEADTAAYLDYLDQVAAAGVDGFVFFGSTGEFVHFEVEERMRVVGLAAKRSRLPVLVNISHSTFFRGTQPGGSRYERRRQRPAGHAAALLSL